MQAMACDLPEQVTCSKEPLEIRQQAVRWVALHTGGSLLASYKRNFEIMIPDQVSWTVPALTFSASVVQFVLQTDLDTSPP